MFLGVDGGGTKTALCLVDHGGRVLARTQAPSCHYLGKGIELVGRVLQQGADEVCREAGITPADIEYAFFGLPTYGEVSADLADLDAVPGQVLGHSSYACGNDMVCGWAGSLGGADGINVISGTGAMTYGERAGQGVRVGGWGELFGDEGSAYWIAARGLGAFSRMSDGRLPVGPLYGVLREHLGLANDLDLVDVVLNRWNGARSEIAALSRTVVEAASGGDTSAARILAEAADELANLVETTRHRLGFEPGETVTVSYSGGTFAATPVLEGFRSSLANLYDGYDLRQPLYPPDVGGALYAAKLVGESLDEGALRHLHEAPIRPRKD